MAVGEFDNIAVPYVMLKKPFCGYVMLFMDGLQPASILMQPTLYKNKQTGMIYISSKSSKSDCVKARTIDEFNFAYNYSGGILKRIKCLAKLAKILGNFEDKDVVYCDISPNNVYISKDPESYETWLIDLDNLGHSSDIRVPIGTPGFMAPEVVKGKRNTIFSDRYSFALIAYRMLLLKEPFLGKAQNDFCSWEDDGNDQDEFEEAVARGEVAWIWEKNDDSNRPTNGLNPYEYLNESIIDLFERTFNADGRNNPTHRPSMWEWYDVLIQSAESSFMGTLKYSESAFEDLKNGENETKYFYQDIRFITPVEPFQKERTIQRYVVNIKNVIELSDEEGNTELIAENDKKIYWNSDKNETKYYLSNYDISNRCPKKYIKDFIVLSRMEKLYSQSNQFNISCSSKDYEVVIVEDNCIVRTISNLLNVTIFIKNKEKIIKKITIEKEC